MIIISLIQWSRWWIKDCENRKSSSYKCCVRENGFPPLTLVSGGFAASSTSLFSQSEYLRRIFTLSVPFTAAYVLLFTLHIKQSHYDYISCVFCYQILSIRGVTKVNICLLIYRLSMPNICKLAKIIVIRVYAINNSLLLCKTLLFIPVSFHIISLNSW